MNRIFRLHWSRVYTRALLPLHSRFQVANIRGSSHWSQLDSQLSELVRWNHVSGIEGQVKMSWEKVNALWMPGCNEHGRSQKHHIIAINWLPQTLFLTHHKKKNISLANPNLNTFQISRKVLRINYHINEFVSVRSENFFSKSFDFDRVFIFTLHPSSSYSRPPVVKECNTQQPR